jgi:hypothetical protein
MLFGTSTQFGIRAGTGATSVPELNIGYSRQEAVIMPLVANVDDDGTFQKPCNVAQPVQVSGGGFVAHPCSLIAINGKAQDSYSVLASFGAKFDGEARADGSKAKGGLAQYFATGVAAQLLALNGGASVVAVGDAAAAAAENPPAANAIGALLGDEAVVRAGIEVRNEYYAFRDKLLAKITLTDSIQLPNKMAAFETAAGVSGAGIAADCTDIAACRDAISNNDPYRHIYRARKAAFDAAFAAWTIP